jgi:hypothetical protein
MTNEQRKRAISPRTHLGLASSANEQAIEQHHLIDLKPVPDAKRAFKTDFSNQP